MQSIWLKNAGHLETSFSLENSIGFIAWFRLNNIDIVQEEEVESDLLAK
jgi:hypothetical protein